MHTKVLIVGCGDLGQALATRLDPTRYEVHGLRRSPQTLPGFAVIQADVTQPATLNVLQPLRPEILVYCVAADAQTDASYKAHYVDGLRHVLDALDTKCLKHVFFVSSTRVYGQTGDDLLDEAVSAIAADFGGERLLEAEALLKPLACGTTVLRLSGIYGPGRTRMLRLAQQPDNWPAEHHWSNRIHRDDAAAFMAYLIEQAVSAKPIDDCYIVTDDAPVSQIEVLNWIAAEMGVAHLAATMPVTGGKRLSNRRLRATGFQLAYPDYRAGYGHLIRSGA
jgi:nucleoside-diphosphate-sugar epimerase